MLAVIIVVVWQILLTCWLLRMLAKSLQQTRFEAEQAIESLEQLLVDYMDEQREEKHYESVILKGVKDGNN